MFRLKDPALIDQILTQVVAPYLADTQKSRFLMPSGEYVRGREARAVSGARNGLQFNAQEFLIDFVEGNKEAKALPALPRYLKAHAGRGAAPLTK
jgi:hypothetical protein